MTGPTPPGTRERQFATSSVEGSTSPSIPSDVFVIPMSINVDPGLIMSGFKKCALPIAMMMISADCVFDCRSGSSGVVASLIIPNDSSRSLATGGAKTSGVFAIIIAFFDS